MFTYYIHDGASALRLKLVGDLESGVAPELEQCRLTAFSTIGDRNFVVDIDRLTSADDAGRELLGRWRGLGAEFLAKSRQARSIGESILGFPLPLEQDHQHDKEAPPCPLRLALTFSMVLLALFIPSTVWAASDPPVDNAILVLARYNGALERNLEPNTEPIERVATALDIEASLPKLAKRGRLQAIRRLVPFGKPEYEVVRSEGDGTVRQQVIARYLSAEAEAQSMPASSFAINNANYKFHYLGPIGTGQSVAYVYKITPRKKRPGLIRGEVWIDAATAVAVRQSGYLVKRPSVFLRRVTVVQDTDLREGRPYLRITHLDVDTLLVGRAELTITERPGEPIAAVR